MNIIQASVFFEKLLEESENKREIKVYRSFIAILSNLKSRDLTEEELFLIENEIKVLNLRSYPKNKRKYFGKKLNVFKAYLKAEFSLISEGYYTSLGMGLGMCFGVAIGSSLGGSGTSMGIAIGMAIGLVIGRTKDVEAEKQNRVLKTKNTDF
tara:strand:+ start:28157 stop:28615 length:459 start_codon:yes stop_codon:yes gene_type:complete